MLYIYTYMTRDFKVKTGALEISTWQVCRSAYLSPNMSLTISDEKQRKENSACAMSVTQMNLFLSFYNAKIYWKLIYALTKSDSVMGINLPYTLAFLHNRAEVNTGFIPILITDKNFQITQ